MKKLFLAFAIAAACVASAAELNLKIATVDMVKLMKEHPRSASDERLLKQTSDEYEEKITKKQAELKKLSEEGKKAYEESQNPMLAAAAKTAVNKKLEDLQRRGMMMQQELRQLMQQSQNELGDLERRLTKALAEDVRDVVTEYGKENKFDFIFDSTVTVYSSKAYDVTSIISKRITDKFMAGSKKDESK